METMVGLGVRCSLLLALAGNQLGAQSQEALSRFFEGKQVIVKLDLPGSQQGVDVYPQRPQPLDMKSYSSRLKKFGTALRNGDSIMVTKVKVKDKNVEFQLGGGGYGTAMDDTDSSVHFTPSDKSGREKDLEDQIRRETDPNRRRSLQRELDDVKNAQERRDQRDRAIAEQTADLKKQQIGTNRIQGGSRFNVRFEPPRPPSEVTPEMITAALEPYVTFQESANGGPPPPPAGSGDPGKTLKKGLTLAQVQELFGQPVETHDRDKDGLKMTTCTFQSKDQTVLADFVNGVLVQYTVSSR